MNEIISDERLEALVLAQNRQVNNPVLLEAQKQAAKANDWKFVYQLSKVAGLETSVLIDAEGRIQIDWGSQDWFFENRFLEQRLLSVCGYIRIHQCLLTGLSLIGRLLAHSTGILESAMVLGEEGFKIIKNTLHISFDSYRFQTRR